MHLHIAAVDIIEWAYMTRECSYLELEEMNYHKYENLSVQEISFRNQSESSQGDEDYNALKII